MLAIIFGILLALATLNLASLTADCGTEFEHTMSWSEFHAEEMAVAMDRFDAAFGPRPSAHRFSWES